MIELHDLSMSYAVAGADITVLDGLSMSVAHGERVAIVGPSGSGKTTLLLLLTGLERPTGGSVRLDGEVLAGLDDDARADLRRERVGIVFQSFHLIPSLTAAENVALPLDIAGATDGRSRAAAMLERVGLDRRPDHYPSQLSGGEQQRVAIARALVHEPSLLVADEPTGNLDEHTGEAIVELLFELNRAAGTTLLLVTHDPELAARCDRTLRLHDGALHDEAPSAGMLRDGVHQDGAERDEERSDSARPDGVHHGAGRGETQRDGSAVAPSPGATPGSPA